MNQPPFEVADIIRVAGKSFIEKNRSRSGWQHLRVLRAIERCRTAALGCHLDQCSRCCHQAISYNSCRNRHCAKCQTNARDKWLAAREKKLLPVRYVRVVFTLPHQLSRLAHHSGRLLKYDRSYVTPKLLSIASGRPQKSDRHLMRPCFPSNTRDEDHREPASMRGESQPESHVAHSPWELPMENAALSNPDGFGKPRNQLNTRLRRFQVVLKINLG
jgi:hypothetical protein